MKRLVIAIDCDDVLVAATEYLIATYNKTYGTKVALKAAHTSKNPAWEANRDEVFKRLHEIQLTDEYASITPSKEAVGVVSRLAKHHELHLVTARDEMVASVTKAMVDTYYPNCFQSIEHVGADRAKGDVCQAVLANVMIDDNLHHLVSARECGTQHLIWFGGYPWQDKTKDVPNGTVRCANWQEVEEYIERIAG